MADQDRRVLDQGNPLRTFPVLNSNASASVSQDVQQQITSVVLGYGIETRFTLTQSAYNLLQGAISQAKSSGGSLSIFGSLYGKSCKLWLPGLITASSVRSDGY